MSFDFGSFTKWIHCQQEQFRCNQCTLVYHKKWFFPALSMCYFCKRFHQTSFRHYSQFLKEVEWCFLQSGETETDRQEFYNNYLQYIANWCKYYHIEPTKEDKKMEEELRS